MYFIYSIYTFIYSIHTFLYNKFIYLFISNTIKKQKTTLAIDVANSDRTTQTNAPCFRLLVFKVI